MVYSCLNRRELLNRRENSAIICTHADYGMPECKNQEGIK